MGTLKGHILSPTSQQWSALRTEDDIQKAVSQFLEEESPRLQGKSFSESIVDVSHWLGSMIQQEREGWAFKIRMAMQEIENHRREALKIQAVMNQCAEQLHMIAECCNMDKQELLRISEKEPKHALPLYIECLSELINSLVEDRLHCLQLLQKKESDTTSLFQMLKEHLQKEHETSKLSFRDLAQKLTDMESQNLTLLTENTRLKKLLMKKTDEIEQVQKLSQLFENGYESKVLKARELPPIERGTPASHQSAPTPVSTTESTIHISEEKLHKLRKSAKKLETSLQDALNQMDNYRKRAPGSMKYSHASMISHNIKLKPLLPNVEDEENMQQNAWETPTENYKHTPKSIQTPREKGNISARDGDHLRVKHPKQVKYTDTRLRHEERNRIERLYPNESQKSCTFRSLVRSLDEMKQRKIAKAKGGKVSKCLRCQKLFTLNDNHKKACCFHPRSKERVEEYNTKGKLQRVTYIWQCCQQGIDSPGCCFGQHL